jgi:hypothetical protein
MPPTDVIPALVAGTYSSAHSIFGLRAWRCTIPTTSLCTRCPMDRGDKPREDRCGLKAQIQTETQLMEALRHGARASFRRL